MIFEFWVMESLVRITVLRASVPEVTRMRLLLIVVPDCEKVVPTLKAMLSLLKFMF